MFRQEQDSGVSPVIGIILMVAVTVGLVALASTIVFDLGSNVNEPADVSANLEYDENDNEVRAEVIRNENADRIFLRFDGNDFGEGGTDASAELDVVPSGGEGLTGAATLTGASNSGTVELVAEVGETGNEQVIRTVEY
jgi:flagellin-like protein